MDIHSPTSKTAGMATKRESYHERAENHESRGDPAWIEAREGRPAVARTAGKAAVLCVDFGEREDDLQPVEWEEFFAILDGNELAFVHQDITAEGLPSRFNKFVQRE
ncbi:hypothetical protein [Mesorhizobium sp. CA14]|uniref:hypothetical protein n=1 Tax=Mesorhizobium sp. CA14 TaxID=2876642 RepID=UPI0029624E13|nr:hypothetical protein [Mesorhizobium sp. CA14]